MTYGEFADVMWYWAQRAPFPWTLDERSLVAGCLVDLLIEGTVWGEA